MIHISLDDVAPAMKLALPVYASGGRILLGKGAELTSTYVQRLKGFDVHNVWIHDDRFSDINRLEFYTEETRGKLSTRLMEMCTDLRTNRSALRKILAGVVFDRVILEAQEHKREPIPTFSGSAGENPFVAHSVNVCLMATALGVLLQYSREQILNLAVGSLIHDIGMAVPKNRDDEFHGEWDETSREHARKGFEAVMDARQLSATIGVVCLQHHERLDGSGFPQGLSYDSIHPFSRIVAIADYYDTMVRGRNRLMPHKVFENLKEGAGTLFDPQMVDLFCSWIVPYVPGTPFHLSTGEQAVVIHVEEKKLDRPIVRALSEDGSIREIDLSQEPEILIEEVSWGIPVINHSVAA
jgi:HD-GYP domain-containing protein (c-di-GMP phosphodiesterase class II)